MIYHRGGRRVLRPFQSSLWFSDASAFLACSAVKLEDIVISLDFPIVPPETLKIDNDSAFGANLPHEKYIGKLAFFLLNLGVYPYGVKMRLDF